MRSWGTSVDRKIGPTTQVQVRVYGKTKVGASNFRPPCAGKRPDFPTSVEVLREVTEPAYSLRLLATCTPWRVKKCHTCAARVAGHQCSALAPRVHSDL